MTTLDHETANKYSTEYGKEAVIDEINASSLTDIIDSTSYKDQQIDVLTVDAEGHDYEVLSSLDYDRYRPRIILAENHERELSKIIETKIHKLLDAKGYTIVNWVGFTLFYSSIPVDEMHVQHTANTKV